MINLVQNQVQILFYFSHFLSCSENIHQSVETQNRFTRKIYALEQMKIPNPISTTVKPIL